MKRKILGRKMRGKFAKPLNHNRRSGSEKNKADLSWDAVTKKYFEDV